LLIKYGALFHPGKPWEPLAQSLLNNVKSRGVDKNAIDYAAKFVKGAWAPLEPLLLNKLFLQTRNMENMRHALDYAIRARKTRWPEFEQALAKAKPGRASGYGAAEYAIRVLKQPYSKFPDIKRKKNGKINAEECMIIGNPPEAKRYADAFGAGERWTDFETKALEANNLVALVNYAAGQKQRMPELEKKILEGEKDAQESKGRRRYQHHTDLPLLYSKEVIKGRWPEYEQKILDHVKALDKKTGYGHDEYTPSSGEQRGGWHGYGGRDARLGSQVSDYIEGVIKGRWPEMEQILLARYPEHPDVWVQNQNAVDGYLSSIALTCKQRYDSTEPAEEEEDTRPTLEQINNPRPRPDKRKLKPFTTFTQDQQCYWPEGEQRLVTRDTKYEQHLMQVLIDRAQPAKSEEEKGNKSWLSEKEKYVAPEELKNIRPPAGKDKYDYDDPNKPDYTIYKGMYVSGHGMGEMEKYVGYFHANGIAVPELEDVLEIAEDLEDAQGRFSVFTRPRWRGGEKPAPAAAPAQPEQQELPLQEQAQGATASMKKKFQSSLLRKKALVEIHDSPTMLPPRTDIRRHIDKDEQLALTDDVRDGINPNIMKPPINQIDPRINPDGVVASNKFADAGTWDLPTFKQWWAKAKLMPQAVKENFTVETVPGLGGGAGALRMNWKGKPLGYVGFPLEIFEGVAGPIQRWMERGTQHDLNVDLYQMEQIGSKQADYTDQDWMDDEAAEFELDQVRDAKNEAKRHFMEEDYIQQLCNDFIPPKTMEEMWDIMGEEYTAEFYGYPYQREQDFTDQDEGGWEGHKQLNDSTGNAGRFASGRKR